MNRSNRKLLRLFQGCMLLILVSCSNPEPNIDSLTDAAGRDVIISGDVRRIVTMAPGVTEIVQAAGAIDKVVGVTTADNYPPEVADISTYTAFPAVDFEAVVKMQPDLVLAALQVNSPDNVSAFEALGIPVFFLASSSVDEILESVRQVGRMAGTVEQANAAADSLQGRIDSLRSLTADAEHQPSTIFLISDSTPYSFGPESYIHDMIEWAGGTSLTETAQTQAPVLSDEFMLASGVEVILGAFGQDYDPSRMLEHHPIWAGLPALRSGRVYSIDADITLRAGPRVVEGAWEMARALHPELFSP